MKPRVVRISDNPAAATQTAAEVLRGGGVAAFPTETVYGVGAAYGDAAADNRLRLIKGRDAAKPFQVLIADFAQAEELGAAATPLLRRLAECFWPGPLTLVVDRAGGGTLGLRVPDGGFVRELLLVLGRPLTASSANHAGEPPALDGAQALAALGDEVDLVVDGGRVEIGLASTVAKLEGGRLAILREGAIPAAELRALL